MFAFRPSRTRSALTVLMLVSLLLAQWIGLQHRMEHADRQQWALGVMPDTAAHADSDRDSDLTPPSDKRATQHSCLLFDASCAAPLLLSTFVAFLALTTLRAAWRRSAGSIWDASPLRYFSSRAPPAL